jgi:hypothetical protein
MSFGKEIVCVHHWSTPIKIYEPVTPTAEVEPPMEWKHCPRCRTSMLVGDLEPRVVIGRIE